MTMRSNFHKKTQRIMIDRKVTDIFNLLKQFHDFFHTTIGFL